MNTINYIKNNKKLFLLILLILLVIIISCILIKYRNNKDTYTNNTEYILPKTIWMFWDKEELPNHISLIYNNNKKILNDWDINLLNNNNIKDYLDFDSFQKNYESLAIQAKTDLIRLKLLNKYGGIWMDASIIINSKTEFEKMFNDTVNNKVELSAFTLYEKDDSFKYHQYIESWFLIAPKNSYIISLWLEEFEKAINMGFDEYNKYITDTLKVKICNEINKFGSYLTIHKTLQVVLQNKIVDKDYTPKLLLFKSEDNMFKLYSNCNWDNNCIKDTFENNLEIKNIPYIKLTGSGNGLNMDKFFSK